MAATETDAELLARYVATADESAFTEVVRRHGGAVYRICFRQLADAHEAEDAAQAVFMVLVRQARSVGRRPDLAGWLHGVARRTALFAARTRARRARRQEEAAMLRSGESAREPETEPASPEALRLLDGELAALPVAQRQAVMLRHLEGRSEQEAAAIAGVPQGTLSQRASRGIERLRERLGRRGCALGTAALLGLLEAEAASAAEGQLPAGLLPSIVAASKSAAAPAAAGLSALATGAKAGAAGFLMEGVLKAMFYAKLKLVGATLAAVVTLAVAAPVTIHVVTGAAGGEAVQTGATDGAIKGKIVKLEERTATIDVGKNAGVRQGFLFGCKAKNYQGWAIQVDENKTTLRLEVLDADPPETSKPAVGDLVQTGFTVILADKPTLVPIVSGEAVNGLAITLIRTDRKSSYVEWVDAKGDVGARQDPNLEKLGKGGGTMGDIVKDLKARGLKPGPTKDFLVQNISFQIRNTGDKPIQLPYYSFHGSNSATLFASRLQCVFTDADGKEVARIPLASTTLDDMEARIKAASARNPNRPLKLTPDEVRPMGSAKLSGQWHLNQFVNGVLAPGASTDAYQVWSAYPHIGAESGGPQIKVSTGLADRAKLPDYAREYKLRLELPEIKDSDYDYMFKTPEASEKLVVEYLGRPYNDSFEVIERAAKPARWTGPKVVSNTITICPDPNKLGLTAPKDKPPDKPETF